MAILVPCCLLVDPFVSTRIIHNTLYEKGIRCIVLLTPLEIYSEEYKKHFDHKLFKKIICLREENKPEVLQQLQQEGITFVQAGRDYSVQIADEFATKLCPKYANSPETSYQRMNKFEMQEAARKAGLRSTFQYKLEQSTLSKQDREKLKEFTFPVILKPLESSGSFGVQQCATIDEISIALNDLFGQKTIAHGIVNGVVVQERLLGDEYVVDSMSLQGKHINNCIFRYGKTLHQGRPIYRFVDVVAMNTPEAKTCSSYIKKVLDVVGLKNGLSHAELFLTPKGPCLVEINPRVSGLSGFHNYVAKRVYGLNQIDILAETILDSDMINHFNVEQFTFYCHARIILVQNFEHKILDQFNAAKILQTLPSYDSHLPLMTKGSKHFGSKDLSDVIAFVALIHHDPKQIEADTQQIWRWEQEHKLF